MSFIFVVFEMGKKKSALFTVVLQLSTWGAPKRVSALDAAVETRCTWSPIFFIFIFLFCARDSASPGCRHSLSFPARPAAALSSVSGNPFPTVRFIFSSTQPRLLASVHFLRGLAQSQLPAAAVTSEHTLESCACAHS